MVSVEVGFVRDAPADGCDPSYLEALVFTHTTELLFVAIIRDAPRAVTQYQLCCGVVVEGAAAVNATVVDVARAAQDDGTVRLMLSVPVRSEGSLTGFLFMNGDQVGKASLQVLRKH